MPRSNSASRESTEAAVRAIAVDWSGRKSGERSVIRLAEARGQLLTRIEGGRTRAEVIDHLIDEASRDPRLIVGFDFSFSLPQWFLRSHGLERAPQLWDLAAASGEDWLKQCAPPFWGLPGRPRPPADSARPQLRATDIATAALAGPNGRMPRSPFQISGAGSVGAATVRGMPFLPRLREAGFRVWPWDALEPPAVVEVWTRIAIGDAVKSSFEARTKAVAEDPRIPAGLKLAAAESEDSFDAATTAVWLAGQVGTMVGTARSRRATDLLEGSTWVPPADRLGP